VVVTTPLRLAKSGEESTGILQVAIERAGVLKGARAVEMVIAWSTAVRQLGHELGADEGGHLSAAVRDYSRYWKSSERTVWRELARFRAVFPEEESPARLAGMLLQLTDERRAERAAVSDLRLAV
jgi:hypothetical protein